jgi:BirA family biotin operon repressor/biotin-[acetyl-CoA-carboxylase] ligase
MTYSKVQILNKISRKNNLRFDIFPIINSTNQYLLENNLYIKYKYHACLAEHQTAGRGRQGRIWYSSHGNILCLSLKWISKTPPTQELFLNLVKVVINSLQNLYVKDNLHLDLKLPNDIFYQNKKLAGLLLETSTKIKNNHIIVLGLGLNIKILSEQNFSKNIQQPWIDLETILQHPIENNELVGKILNNLINFLQNSAINL